MCNLTDQDIPQISEYELELQINDLIESYGDNLCFVFTYSLVESKEVYVYTKKIFNDLIKDLKPLLDIECISAKPEDTDSILVTLIGAADETQRITNYENIHINILSFYKKFSFKTEGYVLTAMLDIFDNDKLDPIEQYAFGDKEILLTAGLNSTEFNN